MEPVFFVLAIMGCGDGAELCSEARVEPAHYSTLAQCRADLNAALSRHTDLSFPVISAACRANGPQWVDKNASAKRG